MPATADIGLIGLAVMGENLALNIESRGFKIAVFNRTTEKVDALLVGRAQGKKFVGCHSIEELVAAVKTPRKIMMMVKVGQPVDDLIEQLLPHLSPGDVLIDSGNEHHEHRAADEVHREQGAALHRHRRQRRLRSRVLLRAPHRRCARRSLRLGWSHGAMTPPPRRTTMVTLDHVQAFAKGGSARIQR